MLERNSGASFIGREENILYGGEKVQSSLCGYEHCWCVQEQEGGQCGWCRMSSREGQDNKSKVGRREREVTT